jgi:hypothetical protein
MIREETMDNTKPFSYTGAEAVEALKEKLFGHMQKLGLNPLKTDEWKKGIFGMFGTTVVSLPDLNERNYIIAANHISDFDAVILGLLHPRIRIIAKAGWAFNDDLMGFLKHHYDIAGIYRDAEIEKMNDAERKAANENNFKVMKDCLKYLRYEGESRHLLIFPQGTISDINKNGRERVNQGFAKLSVTAKAKVINLFTEYPALGGITRIIGSAPYEIEDRNRDYRQEWLDGVIGLQNRLGNVRTPVLSEKHSNNNNPGDPFF